jgi:hypothetical protein
MRQRLILRGVFPRLFVWPPSASFSACGASRCIRRGSTSSRSRRRGEPWVSLRVASPGRDCSDLAEEVEQFADFVAALGWVAHLGFLVDQVAVAPAASFAFEESGFLEVDHDPLGCSFGDADCLGDVSEPDVGIVRDAKQHLGVVCEERPVRCSIA